MIWSQKIEYKHDGIHKIDLKKSQLVIQQRESIALSMEFSQILPKYQYASEPNLSGVLTQS